MSLLLLNNKQEYIENVTGNNLYNLLHEEEINKADFLLAELSSHKWLVKKDQVGYMAIRDRYDSKRLIIYKVNGVHELGDRVGLTGVNAAYDELKASTYIKKVKGTDLSVREIIELILPKSGWVIGEISDGFPTLELDMEYVSSLDVIKELINLTDGEVSFRANLNPDGTIGDMMINFVKELGSFKGKRFALGSNLMEVTKEENFGEVVTAMVGSGSKIKIDSDDPNSEEELLTFAEVEWKVSKGDPVDKPIGQEYVEIPEATEKFGYADGSPRFGFAQFSGEKSPENLLIQTYNELLTASRPLRQFRAIVQITKEDMDLGETIAIIKPRTDFRYFTRVYKVKRDLLDNSRTEVEFGDKLVKTEGERLKAIKDEVINEVENRSGGDGSGSGSGSGGGVGPMRYIKDAPVNHTVFSPYSESTPSNRVDGLVDGFVQEFRHERRPEFSHPLDPNVPDGQYIETAHEPPTWAPKPGYGGFGTDGPRLIKYLYANDGRIYISWNDMEMYYLTSNFLDVFQAVHGYYPRDKEYIACPDGFILANDDDFGKDLNGNIVYTGGSYCVELPKTINGVTLSSYVSIFSFVRLNGVKHTNNTAKIMDYMFSNTLSDESLEISEFILDLREFDTRGVTSMKGMFRSIDARILLVDNFDTSEVTDMSGMFSGSSAQSLSLNSFDTSNVTSMREMFRFSRVKVLDISSFDTRKVNDMGGMFGGISLESLDLSNFDTSSVTSMWSMFNGARVDTLDLSSFDTANVTNMSFMFANTTATTGYARTQEDADRFNDASITRIPDHLTFVVK